MNKRLRVAVRRRWNRMIDPHLSLVIFGLSIGLGTSLLIGSADRTTSPTFQTAKEIMPIRMWGVLFLISGLVGWALETRPKIAVWLLAVGAVLYSFWAAAFVLTAYDTPHAALTSAVVYPWLVSLHYLAARGLVTEIRRSNRRS